MKLLIDNKILFSVQCWLDNLLVNKLDAYKVNEEMFFPSVDSMYGVQTFQSTKKQWVYDSENTLVPQGAYLNGAFKHFDQEFFPDFDNGRIFALNLPSGENTVSGKYQFKEINTYLHNDAEQEILLDGNYSSYAMEGIQKSGVEPYKLQLPALFPVIINSKGKALELGNTESKQNYITVRVICFYEQVLHQNAVQNLLRGQLHKSFRLLEEDQTPLNEYGNIKQIFSGEYKYSQIPQNQEIFVDKVDCSIISRQSKAMLQRNLKYGVIDLNLLYIGAIDN